jgi:rhodanese-related sulfurtransferase
MNQLVLSIISLMILVACNGQPKVNTDLSPQEFQRKMSEQKNVVLIDVRTPEEVQQERIKGEVNMDFYAPEFKTLIKGMDKNKPYYLYCASGIRSRKAAKLMREEGIREVDTLAGGIQAWLAAGLPVVD